jgi:hypothetical protein
MRCSRRMDKQQSVVSLLDLLCTDPSYFGGKVNESREIMTTTHVKGERSLTVVHTMNMLMIYRYECSTVPYSAHNPWFAGQTSRYVYCSLQDQVETQVSLYVVAPVLLPVPSFGC